MEKDCQASRLNKEDAMDRSRWTHKHTRLTALFSGLPGRAGTRKVKPIWISLKQETVSDSGISWAVILKVLLVNLLAALNFANVFLEIKNVWKIKIVKKRKKT